MTIGGSQPAGDTGAHGVADRARRLFEFLGRAQQLRSRPVRVLDDYRSDGDVLWLDELPEHPAITSSLWTPADELGEAVLFVDRVPKVGPPRPDDELLTWLDGAIDDPAATPVLGNGPQSAADPPGHESPGAAQAITAAYASWMERWHAWADRERLDRPVRAIYPASAVRGHTTLIAE